MRINGQEQAVLVGARKALVWALWREGSGMSIDKMRAEFEVWAGSKQFGLSRVTSKKTRMASI